MPLTLMVFVPEERAIENGKVWVIVGPSSGRRGGSTGEKISLKIPMHLIGPRFCAGWQHAWRGGQLSRKEHLKRSFTEGFRAARFVIDNVRRKNGIIGFPTKYKFRMRLTA